MRGKTPTPHLAAVTFGELTVPGVTVTQWLIWFSSICLLQRFDNAMVTCNCTALMFEKGQFQKAANSRDEMSQSLLLSIVNTQTPQVADLVDS
jgi:hypothetical protein